MNEQAMRCSYPGAPASDPRICLWGRGGRDRPRLPRFRAEVPAVSVSGLL